MKTTILLLASFALLLLGCPPERVGGDPVDDDDTVDDDDSADDDDTVIDDDDTPVGPPPADGCSEYSAVVLAPAGDSHPASEPLQVEFAPSRPPDAWIGLHDGFSYVTGGESEWSGSMLSLTKDLQPGTTYYFEGGWICFTAEGDDIEIVLFEVEFRAE